MFESGGRRWLFRSEERADWGGKELVCERRGASPGRSSTICWSRCRGTEQRLRLPGDDHLSRWESRPALRRRGGLPRRDRTSWVEGTRTSNDPHPLDDSPPEQIPKNAVRPARGLALVGEAAAGAGGRDVWGRRRWTGKPDADFSVRVLVVPQGLKVELAATDDRAVRPAADADARALVRADHFELWFCAENEHSNECQGKPAQLGVARTAGGGALARWLRPHPRGAPVPAVSLEKDCLAVILPRALVGAEPGPHGWPVLVPLTVAYSDSDDPAAGQQTMVSTATINRAKPESPSLLLFPTAIPRFHAGPGQAAGIRRSDLRRGRGVRRQRGRPRSRAGRGAAQVRRVRRRGGAPPDAGRLLA